MSASVHHSTLSRTHNLRADVARHHLRTETVAVETLAAASLASLLILDLGPGRALGWAVAAALAGIALVQSVHLLAPGQDPPLVDLVGADTAAAARPRVDDEDGASLFGTILAVVAIPFVAAFVAVRIAILYAVPTAVVAAATAMAPQIDWRAPAAAWLGSVLVSVVNEFAVVRPIARRHHVPLD